MGHVREQRAIQILEDSLLQWLEDGRVPTTGELEQAYEEGKELYQDLTRSAIRQVSLPERWAESSASGYNSILDAVEKDLDVLLKSLVQITELGIVTLSEWNSRGISLETRIASLRSRIESLVLLKSDTAGYVSFVEEGFLSLENISSDTTASVDTHVGEVTMNIDRTEGQGVTQGTQIDLISADVTFTPIERGNVKFYGRSAGSHIAHIVTDKHRRWGVEVNATRPQKRRTSSQSGKPIIGELKVNLTKETEVSKIVLIASDATAGIGSVITAQYSTEGYTWSNVPCDSAVQSGTGNFVWRFAKTPMLWVKFIISKASPDATQAMETIYDFGFRQLKMYSEVFETPDDGVQVVSELMTPKLGGSDVTFGRTSLEVCDEVPSDTSIQYFLRAYDGAAYTSWIQVAPLGKANAGVPAVVDFAAPTEVSSEDLTTIFDSTIDTEALNIMRIDGAGSFSYRFDGPNDTVANFYIDQSDSLLADLVLLRNIGYSAGKFPTVSDDLEVGDVKCGWGLESDSSYYCVFRVQNPNGLKLDFGSSQAVLDGKVVSGSISISTGWHTFRTDRKNWGSLSGTAPTTETELKALDPLYPWNHKYLIEGYDYPDGWSGAKPYLGADEYAQYKATKIGRHTFVAKDLDFSVYATDVISGPKTIVLLKFDSSRPNYENERVRFFCTRRFDSFEGVQVKAILRTDDMEKSPVLSYYRVRVK